MSIASRLTCSTSPLPPTSPLFPYTTLFRSCGAHRLRVAPYRHRRTSNNSSHTHPWRRPLHENQKNAHTFLDRKSTRLNSSHRCISYAVFCLKKKKELDDHPGLM